MPEDIGWTEQHQQNSEPDAFCEWCNKPIKLNKAVIHETLFKMFGYIYCDQNCALNHIHSK